LTTGVCDHCDQILRHALRKLGRDLALARRKRGISTADMAARQFVNRDTLWRLERGEPTVAVDTLATATFVLQLHDRLANLAAPATDELGLNLDELQLPKRIRRARPYDRGSSKKPPSTPTRQPSSIL
jgi:transcriptional regulator with XRE-family HTH domain